jgi:hypothetical protein
MSPMIIEFEITDDNNQIEEDIEINKEDPTVVQEEITAKGGYVVVYPNPAERSFNVEFNSYANSAEILMFDMLGRVHIRKIVNTLIGGVESVGFRDIKLPSGSYFIIIRSGIKEYKVPIIIAQ